MATLVVVMVLFFIVSLTAAYTSRNLIFEQRTSNNQYRSTQALEAAEAGVEWVLAMLSHQRITATCTNSSTVADGSYRERYLVTDWATGKFTPRTKTDGVTPMSQACVYNGSSWNCSCPSGDTDPAPVAPAGAGVFPAFHVRLEQIGVFPPAAAPAVAGVIRIHSVGCTRLDDACLGFGSQGMGNEGRSAIRTVVALTGNAVAPPSAALLAHGAVDLTGAATVVNSDPAGSGITVHSGGAVTAPLIVRVSTPGSLPESSVVEGDAALAPTALGPFSADDRRFATTFNMKPASFQQQPATVAVPCTGGDCTAADVRNAIQMNPGRPLWVQGNLLVDSGSDIGSAAAPVLMVVDGNVQFSVGGVTVHGLTYARTANWEMAGSGTFNGAVVAQGQISSSATSTPTPTIVRDAEVLRRVRWGSGSFVRLPGGWKDFE